MAVNEEEGATVVVHREWVVPTIIVSSSAGVGGNPSRRYAVLAWRRGRVSAATSGEGRVVCFHYILRWVVATALLVERGRVPQPLQCPL